MSDTTERAGESRAERPAQGRPVLIARNICRHYGRMTVLDHVDLTLRAGEVVVVIGRRNAGKSVLARLLAGLIPPDSGELWRSGQPAPIVGTPGGFGVTGTLERDLGFRASAYGIDTRDYIAAVEPLLGDLAQLDRPFSTLESLDRQAILYGANYLIPSDLYVVDGTPVPMSPELRERIEPLFAACRRRAGVIWFTSAANQLGELRPDRVLHLENGGLAELAGFEEAIELFMPGSRRPPPPRRVPQKRKPAGAGPGPGKPPRRP